MEKRISTKKIDDVLINLYLLNWKLSEKGIFGVRLEGMVCMFPQYINDIVKYTRLPDVHNIMDIGFNSGHTAVALLSANKKVNVTSFDLGHNNYKFISKKFIDTTFPRRHKLIIGDSVKTIPEYHKKNMKHKFDLIIIDRTRDFEYTINDITNCKQMVHKKTIIIIVDTIVLEKQTNNHTKNNEPSKLLTSMLESKKINIISYHKYNDIKGVAICNYIN